MNVEDHFQQLYRTVPARFSFQATTPDALAAWQAAFRPELEKALGLTQMRHDLAGYQPRAQRKTIEPMDGYLRESWLLWTEPTLCLPFTVLKPDAQPGPLPLVLTTHGHNQPHMSMGIFENPEEQNGVVKDHLDVALQAVRQGYLVIAPTARGFGETRSADDRKQLSSCRTQHLHGLLVGRTPIGERVWDISRLIDWALDNLHADPRRIAITGNSGGGTISLFAPACDTRIAVAVPSCYFCTFVGSIGSIYHCDCNFVPGLLRLGEMYDVAGLIAPRPFCAVAGTHDDIFPIADVRLAFEKLQHIYRVAGTPNRCQLFVGPDAHRYYPEGAWPFIREFL